jgi:hypothetical protein
MYFSCYDTIEKKNVQKEVKIKVESTSTTIPTPTLSSDKTTAKV